MRICAIYKGDHALLRRRFPENVAAVYIGAHNTKHIFFQCRNRNGAGCQCRMRMAQPGEPGIQRVKRILRSVRI